MAMVEPKYSLNNFCALFFNPRNVCFVFLLFPVLCAVSTDVHAADRRVALIIGNDNYQNISTLGKAINDARAMRQSLTDLKFDVIYAENANLAKMKNLGFEFSDRLKPGDIGFVFYAGHGANLLGSNLLLPVDIPKPANIQNVEQKRTQERRLSQFALPETFFMDRVKEAGARIGIFVLDACRNNPLRIAKDENSLRDLTSGDLVFGAERGLLRQSNPAKGFYTFYSAGYGETALDKLRNTPDADPNSPFTRIFTRNLSLPNMDFHSVAKKTQLEVYNLAQSDFHEQLPTIYEQIIGEKIYLNGNNSAIAEIPAVPEEIIESTTKWFMTAYQNLDFWGGDIIPEGVSVNNVEQCAIACASEKLCRHFTYNEKQNHCFIKSEYNFVVRAEGATSGFIYDVTSGSGAPQISAEFPVSYVEMKGIEFDGLITKSKYQPRPDRRDIASCLDFCENTSHQCNYLTFVPGRTSRHCNVRKTDFTMRHESNSRATSFVRSYETAIPDIGPIELPIQNRSPSGLLANR